VTTDPGRLDGVSLKTKTWKVEPLEIDESYSSYFSVRGSTVRCRGGAAHKLPSEERELTNA
jgi:hypothetical protein